MARYNKIFAGPYTENTPQVAEAILNGAYLPGTAVVWNAGNFSQAGASAGGQILILQDNYLAMKATTDAWLSGDRGVALHMIDEQMFNVLVPTGNNLAKSAALTTSAAGKFVPPTTGQRIVAFTDEAFNNNTGSDQLVRVRAAKSNLAAP